MREMSGWLVNVEELAMRFYEKASVRFVDDRPLSELLSSLALDEKMHHAVVGKAYEILEDSEGIRSKITLDECTRNEVLEYLSSCITRLDSGAMTKDELVEAIVNIEYSECSDAFLLLIGGLRSYLKDLIAKTGNISQHKGKVEHFIKSRPEYSSLHDKVSAILVGRKEPVLVVDKDEAMIEAFNSFLGGYAVIDTAVGAEEALEKLKARQYAAIVVDVSMPSAVWIEFYRRAAEFLPDIKDRFLFLTEYDCDYISFLEDNNLRFLEKPSSIKEIKMAVIETIQSAEASAS